MSKVTVDAVELKDANVTHISLVKRGANRIPFRVVKESQETKMINIDLSKVLKGAKVEAQAPAVVAPSVVAFVVSKANLTDGVMTAIKEAGYSVDNVVAREDGTCVVKQGDMEVDFENDSILRISENLVAVCKGYEPYETEELGLVEVINAHSFFPSLYNACDALREVSYEALKMAATPQEAVAALGPILDEFKGYILSIASAIPSAVFKMDDAVTEALAVKEQTPEESLVVPETTVADESTELVVAKSDEEVEQPKEAPDMATLLKSALDSALAPLQEALKAVSDAVDNTNTTVTGLAAKHDELATKVAEVDVVAKKAATTISNTVIGGAHDDGDDAPTVITGSVTKSEYDWEDTAIARQRNKKQH